MIACNICKKPVNFTDTTFALEIKNVDPTRERVDLCRDCSEDVSKYIEIKAGNIEEKKLALERKLTLKNKK